MLVDQPGTFYTVFTTIYQQQRSSVAKISCASGVCLGLTLRLRFAHLAVGISINDRAQEEGHQCHLSYATFWKENRMPTNLVAPADSPKSVRISAPSRRNQRNGARDSARKSSPRLRR
jgi:hypothetical protein